nr:nitroreductase family protein [Anaerofustis stercorihominis]
MNLKEAAQKRHSVRSYLNKKIEDNKIQKIQNIINECNKKNDFNIQFLQMNQMLLTVLWLITENLKM